MEESKRSFRRRPPAFTTKRKLVSEKTSVEGFKPDVDFLENHDILGP
jgi:hypothetical protein